MALLLISLHSASAQYIRRNAPAPESLIREPVRSASTNYLQQPIPRQQPAPARPVQHPPTTSVVPRTITTTPPRTTPAPVRTEGAGLQEDAHTRISIDADRLEYDSGRRVMVGIGNVRIRQGGDELRADYVEVHSDTREAMARGNVFMERDGQTWEGDALTYNFRTREGDFGDFRAYSDPYYIRAEQSRQVSRDVIELHRPRITTCSETERQEFVIQARSATITDESVLRARHVVVRLYGIPILYTPYLKKDFVNRSNIDIMPGYSSRMGAFLLTAYNWHPTPHVKASTHLDYRSKRGVGVGQRVRWRLPDHAAQGRLQAYYAQDDLPIRSEGQRRIREGLVDEDRYWLGFQHTQRVGDVNFLSTELNYVSDPFVLEDFFDRDFRRHVQPENRITLTHRQDQYTAAILLNMRLNDFYENVNRMPEALLEVNRLEIGDSGFYYESETRASRLERVFSEQAERDAYDTFRVDTLHTVLYPMRHFGFLSVIPSVAYRGTWYADSVKQVTTTAVTPQLDEAGEPLRDEAGVILLEEQETVVSENTGALYRNLIEYRLETSYKAFKVLSEEQNYLGRGVRHMAEPYARYSYIPTPNVVPDELYQFDEIDRLNEQHQIRLGVRNKLQTRMDRGRIREDIPDLDEFGQLAREESMATPERDRHRSRIHDFIDIDTYTIYRVDPAPEQHDFSDFFFDTRLRLTHWMHIDFDGAFDWYDSELTELSARLALFATDRSQLQAEYRFRRDQRETVRLQVSLFPRETWSYTASWRYDIEDGELEEQSYMVQRRFDCTMLGIGVRGRLTDGGEDTDWRVWAQVTLLAFPDMEMRLGR